MSNRYSTAVLFGAALLSSPALAQQEFDAKGMLDHAQAEADKSTGGKLMDRVGGHASGGSATPGAGMPIMPQSRKTRSLEQLLRATGAPVRDLELPRQ
ncbi:MAG: hypothetical protein AB7O43_18095 [Hyphomicrobiaceae bacterium]